MTELIVVRHGETDYNIQRRFQGQVDAPLNANGRAQAARVARRLAAEPVDLLLASDLSRARETAEAIAQARGAPAPRVDPAWREQGFGAFEGLDGPAIRAAHARAWADWLRHEPDYALPGGGESNRSFHGRVVGALRALIEAHPGRRIVLVTHGGVLDMLWRTARGESLAGARRVEIPNTGLNHLRWEGDVTGDDGQRLLHDPADGPPAPLRILRWGEADHLAGLQLQSTVWTQPASPDAP